MSDTTALHVALGRRAGLVTFWGPTLMHLRRGSAYTRSAFFRALSEPSGAWDVGSDPDGVPVRTVVPGVAEGPLVGGTTTLLAAGLGTPWEVDTEGAILLLEDVGEEPYAIDRLLTHLDQAGKLRAAAGILLAEHVAIASRRHDPAFEGNTLSLEEIIEDRIARLGVPTLHGLPLGHGRHLATVPLGVPARLDAGAGTLTVLESGVCGRGGSLR
jgi:muramoyltetrapeptide carboxypeptidase